MRYYQPSQAIKSRKTLPYSKEESALSSRQCTHATCAVAMAKLYELKFKLLPHPSYSTDLAPSDFFLFPKMKKCLAEKKFESNENISAETEVYFEELPKSQKYSRDSFIARREGIPPPQLSVRLVFRASNGLVAAPTTVLDIRQKWGLGERSGFAIDESCNKRVLTVM